MPSIKSRIARHGFLAIISAVAGCDLSVTNPGPVKDESLNTPAAISGLVNGMSGDLSLALGTYIDRAALATGELAHSGNFITEGAYFRGELDAETVNGDWGRMQRARWVAENGLERMKTVLGADFETNTNTPRAYLYAGFANRLLGENACRAVIDGGPALSDSVHFERADSLFSRALVLATARGNTAVANAARGGRASVRAWLGNWSGAVTDAAGVPASFVFNAVFSTNTARENNDLAVQTINRRETTVFGTVYASQREVRTPWDTVKTTGGRIQTGQDGRTNFFRQTKYKTVGAPVPLTKGAEMLLLRAENALRGGDVAGGMILINQERAVYSIAPVSASTLQAAWTLLQRERGSVLWLEGRRLWDLRRWYLDSGPARNTYLEGRGKCMPPGSDEQAANPNL